MRSLIFLGLCVVLLSACSQSKQPLKLHGPGVERLPDVVWPDPPEQARFRFAGELVGEDNFLRNEEESVFTKSLKWLARVFSSKANKIELQRPQTGLVDSKGRIIVTDVGQQALFVFTENQGLKLWDSATDQLRFVIPIGVVETNSGEFLVADAELGAVYRLGQDGQPLGVFAHEELTRPTGLAYDTTNGSLYVADTRSHEIKVFDENGVLIKHFGGHGETDGMLNAPTHLTVYDGKLYVVDTLNARVQIFSLEGEFIQSFGRRGLFKGNFVRPKGIAVDRRGIIYVVESYYDHLLVFNQNHDFLMPIGGSGSGIGQFSLPSGVWVDETGRIFIADMFNGRVLIFEHLGEA